MKKIYLILGASSDLGKSLISELIDKDNIVIAHYYRNQTIIQEIKKLNPDGDIREIKADLSDMTAVKEMIDVIDSWQLSPTHIVNLCANTFQHTRMSQWQYNVVDRDMKIQVFAFAEVMKKYLPVMAKNNYGKIVVMLTAYTIGTPPKNMAGYCTVKYALLGLMKSIASDYGDQGININGVSPGMINTKFIDGIGRKIKEFTAESNPRHRNLEVEDVVPTIKMLLSDSTEFMNGTNINLSGRTD